MKSQRDEGKRNDGAMQMVKRSDGQLGKKIIIDHPPVDPVDVRAP